MKKLLFALCVLLAWAGVASGATYTVCSSGCDKASLQAALTDYDLGPGDIIQLQENVTECVNFENDDTGDASGYVTLDLNNHTIDGNNCASDDCIYITSADDYIKIKNGTITNAGRDGIRANGSDHLYIENCTITSNGAKGFNAIGSSDTGTDDSTFIDCIIYDNAEYGIKLSDNNDDNTITNCTIYNNGTSGDYSGIVTNESSTNTTITNCTIYNNGNYGTSGSGIEVYGASGVNVSKCLIYNEQNPIEAKGTAISNASITVRNSIMFNGRSFSSGGAQDGYECTVTFQNNTILSEGGIGIEIQTASSTVQNNIIYLTSSGYNYALAFRNISSADIDTCTISNNCWYYSNTNNKFAAHDTALDGYDTTWAAMSNFTTDHSGLCANGLDASDPLFVSSSPSSDIDFKLQHTSPCINAGTNLSSTFTDDYFGSTRPVGSAFDIGACEYDIIYAKKISGVTYYDTSAASCDDVTTADTAGDLEAAVSAAVSGGTCYVCSDLAGTDLDSDNTLDIANAITLDLQENTLSYNASYLIGISADYVTVQNGTLYTGPIIDGATNAVQITGSQTVLSNLTFGQTTNATIDISGSAEDITIKKCAVFPESSGSFVYAHGTNSNITVRNCVLSKKGIQFFSGVSSCTVENNSIYAMNTYGVRILASDSSTFTIKNNIFTGCDYGVHDNDATNDPDMDYNCYYNSVTADVYQCSKGAHAVSADPKLGAATPAAVTQFDLMSSSPCVGAGVAISGITDDYRGNSRKAVPSIGALEPLFVGTQ